MLLERLTVGPLATNCYIIGPEDGGMAAVVDPGGDADRILAEVAARRLTVVYVIDTHGHADHVAANGPVLEATGATLAIHGADAPVLADPVANISAFVGGSVNSPPAGLVLADGDELNVGELTLRIMHTPGHTPGSVVILADDALFSGDTLFAGSVGRTDLPGGSARQLADSLRAKIEPLDPRVVVYPGHGESTTIGREKTVNPFLQGEP